MTAKPDLTERLRECGPKDYHNGTEWVGKRLNRDGEEAAAEIERLRANSADRPLTDAADCTADLRRLALCAAAQAASATAELLEAAQNGPLGANGPFGDEPIELLADATKLAIEAARAGGEPTDPERAELYSALCRYLEGWS